MTKFPDPLPLPGHVEDRRKERRSHMLRMTRRGILVRSLIVSAELLGYVFLSSSVLLLDALSSLVDVAASLFLMLCVRLADKPPDKNHPFGHGRFEPIAGLQLGLLLAVIGVGMLFQQISAAVHESAGKEIDRFTWIIPLCAVILLELCYQMLKRASVKEKSPALLADAIHYRVDSINSLFALVALVIAAYYPKWSVFIDHLGAIAIAGLMVGLGVFAAKSNLHQLLDRKPGREYFKKVREAAMRVSGVLATEKLRLQIYGPDAHVAIDIEVDPHLTVEASHKITQEVRAEIQKSWPAVRDVIVHVEPYFADDHLEEDLW